MFLSPFPVLPAWFTGHDGVAKAAFPVNCDRLLCNLGQDFL